MQVVNLLVTPEEAEILSLAGNETRIQLVLRNVESSDLALALKGVSTGVREKIMRNLSTRAAENLAEEILSPWLSLDFLQAACRQKDRAAAPARLQASAPENADRGGAGEDGDHRRRQEGRGEGGRSG